MKSVRIDPQRLALTPQQTDALRRGILDNEVVQALRSSLAGQAIAPENVELGKPEARSEEGQTIVEAPLLYAHELRGSEWGAAEGVVIDVPATLRLTLNASGLPEECVYELPEEEEWGAAASFVRGLAARNEIAPSPLDSKSLMAQRKPYYITIDDSGRKRLQRAFFSLTTR